MRKLFYFFIAILSYTSAKGQTPADSVAKHSPLKTLSDEQYNALIKGDDIYGMSLAAELNHYPLPDKVIKFKKELNLGPLQISKISAIAKEFDSLGKLKKQLKTPAAVVASTEKEVCTSQLGVWQVCSTLLNLGQSDILLCQRQGEFAVMERFRDDVLYAKANGNVEILLQGKDSRELAAAFHANAKHTLEFMASNQVATAQKVIWEQFPDHRPGRLVAAISERCRLAIANEETISQTRQMNQSNGKGMRI